jgi:hypothetical protein
VIAPPSSMVTVLAPTFTAQNIFAAVSPRDFRLKYRRSEVVLKTCLPAVNAALLGSPSIALI